MKQLAALFLSLLLVSCGRDAQAPTAEENRQLDDAANLLNEAPANLEAVDDYGLGDANAAPPEQP